MRSCSRTACPEPAVTTLTYVYADSTAVLGPLARQSSPHSYDLCENHAMRLTVPRGWEIIRLEVPSERPSPADELVALADAVRPVPAPASVEPGPAPQQRAHLRVLPDPTDR
ncbi:DUF3499 domain-containing protein [Micrococcales bacterium 31B]|nr:DUF3499 domain-containing protein [Micrococcales bacterium 31B]